ncbi:hypothetical protein [Cellulomonas sp.]|uniref:hypothetical protein n=1 Tax=Cellulomonas sp. TaxID=40001 RepID=UPI003BACCEED
MNPSHPGPVTDVPPLARRRPTARNRWAALVVGAALLIGAGVVTAAPATAAANPWTTCITPYQKAMNATTGNVSDLIFHIGMANCAAKLANQTDSVKNFDLYYHYYMLWRTHYAQASVVGGKVAIEAWAKLSKYGIKKGLTTL